MMLPGMMPPSFMGQRGTTAGLLARTSTEEERRRAAAFSLLVFTASCSSSRAACLAISCLRRRSSAVAFRLASSVTQAALKMRRRARFACCARLARSSKTWRVSFVNQLRPTTSRMPRLVAATIHHAEVAMNVGTEPSCSHASASKWRKLVQSSMPGCQMSTVSGQPRKHWQVRMALAGKARYSQCLKKNLKDAEAARATSSAMPGRSSSSPHPRRSSPASLRR